MKQADATKVARSQPPAEQRAEHVTAGRRTLLVQAAKAAAVAAALPAGAWAAPGDYPDKPIRVLIGYPPGGGIDTTARTFATSLGKQLGQPVVVESRPGAAGLIAAEAVARAQPDGYFLAMLDNGTLTVQPNIRRKVNFTTFRDFSFLGLMTRMPLVLVAHPSVPATSLAELVRHSKSNPDAITFGSAGLGNPTHIAFEIFRQGTGATIRHIPYKGAAPALADLVGGHIALTFLDVRLSQEFSKDGRVKVLAINDDRRHPLLPTVPTFEESGVRNMAQPPWVALTGPAALPPAVGARITAAFESLARDTELHDTLVRLGYSPSVAGPAAYSALVRSDFDANQRLLKQLNIQLDE